MTPPSPATSAISSTASKAASPLTMCGHGGRLEHTGACPLTGREITQGCMELDDEPPRHETAEPDYIAICLTFAGVR